MGTRCLIQVHDDHNKISIYRHWDGYPDAVLPDLQKALALAWPLPRFEANEFAAAIVAAFKSGPGNIRIQSDHDIGWDIEWIYKISKNKLGDNPVVRVINNDTGLLDRIIRLCDLTASIEVQ